MTKLTVIDKQEDCPTTQELNDILNTDNLEIFELENYDTLVWDGDAILDDDLDFNEAANKIYGSKVIKGDAYLIKDPIEIKDFKLK